MSSPQSKKLTGPTAPSGGFNPEPWPGSPWVSLAGLERVSQDAGAYITQLKGTIASNLATRTTAIQQGLNRIRQKVAGSLADKIQPTFDGLDTIRQTIDTSLTGRTTLVAADIRQLKAQLPPIPARPPAASSPGRPGDMQPLKPAAGFLPPTFPPGIGPPPTRIPSPPPTPCEIGNAPGQAPDGADWWPMLFNLSADCPLIGALWSTGPCTQQDIEDYAACSLPDRCLVLAPPVDSWIAAQNAAEAYMLANYPCGKPPPPPPPIEPPPIEPTPPPPPPPTPPTCSPQPPPEPPPPFCSPSQIDPVTGLQIGADSTCPPTPCEPPPTVPAAPIPSARWCTLTPPDLGNVSPQMQQAVKDITNGITTFLQSIPAAGGTLTSVYNWFAGWANDFVGATGCDVAAMAGPWGIRAFVAFIEHWTSIGFSELIETLSYHIHNACPVLIPDVGAATDAFLADRINQTLFRSWVRANNYCEEPWQKVVEARRTRPDVQQILALNLRGAIPDEEVDQELRKLGVIFGADGLLLKEFQKQIPGAGELLRLAAAHVFEPDTVKALGLDSDYPPDFAAWMKTQGLNYDLTSPPWVAAGFDEFTWSRAYWWGSRNIPTIGQGMEALHRLRPTGGPNGGPRDPSGLVFKQDDLDMVLRANNTPAYTGKILTALSYHTIGLRQLSQMATFNLMTRAELAEALQDIGYRPERADVYARLLRRQAASKRWKAHTAGSKSRVIDAYRIGMVPHDQAAVLLFALTLDDARLYREFSALPDPDKIAIANGNTGVQVELDLIDTEEDARLAREAINVTRKMFLSGRIDIDTAGQRLAGIGVTSERTRQYLRRWQQAFNPQRKELSAERVLKLFREGILNATATSLYLGNLGYLPDDVTLLLIDTERTIALDIAKAQAAAARTAEQRQKALQAAVRAARAEHDRLRSELARHGTPGMMKTWLVLGLLDPADMEQRLLALDWPPDDAAREVAEALLARDQKQQTAADKAAAARARLARQEQAALDKLRRQQEAEEAKPSLTDLKRWLAEGIIDVADARADLEAKQWLPEDIDLWFADLALQGIPPPPGP